MLKSYAISDIGLRRELNEDSIYTSDVPIGGLPNLFIVADGMGGHNAGDLASQYTVQIIVREIEKATGDNPAVIINEAIKKANAYVRFVAKENTELKGMGTTVVAASCIGKTLLVANVGDSRLYIISDTIQQITVDHSLVEEMIKMGGIDRVSARTHPDKNIITRAVGARETVDADFFQADLREGDLILLCSDGLTNMVEDEKILQILKSDKPLNDRVQILVQEANDNGGKDNISVIVIDPFNVNA